MSKSNKRIDQVVKDSDTRIEETEEPQAEPAPQSDIRAGYIVAINEQGNFVFDVIGNNKGLIELLGLHQYAAERIRQVLDASTGTGDRLVQQLGMALIDLNSKVDKLVQATLPPQNKL